MLRKNSYKELSASFLYSWLVVWPIKITKLNQFQDENSSQQ